MCRLTLAWISSEISTKLQGMPTHLDRSFRTALDSLSCRLVTSAVRYRLATCVSRPQLLLPSPFVQFLTRSLTHFRSRRDRGLRPLFGFAPKQTKGSSAWQTTYIVLHHKELCRRLKLEHADKWYIYKPENKMHKILLDIEIQTDHRITGRKSDLVFINKNEELTI